MGSAEDLGRRLLDGAGVTVGGSEPWDIHIHDHRIWDRVVRDRELGLGEAYVDGWFDVEELDQFLVKLVLSEAKSQIKMGPELLKIAAVSALTNRQSKKTAAENASAHYDIGNDLYERMLDKRMIYSSGYWEQATDLDGAQEAKLDLICRKLQLEPGMTLLDIGCGWGGFSRFAAERYHVTVTGVSPAAEQVRLAQNVTSDLDVTIRQVDYRDVTGTFDRIVSIGMFEHVGSRNYRTFFRTCDRLLAADGLMLHHTIGSNSSHKQFDAWFDKYIFPGGILPSVAQIAKAVEPRFTIEDLHSFGPHYDTTLQHWYRNVEEAWPALPAYDERFRRLWRYYLKASMAGFRVRNTQLWQIVFRRTMRHSDVYTGPR